MHIHWLYTIKKMQEIVPSACRNQQLVKDLRFTKVEYTQTHSYKQTVRA